MSICRDELEDDREVGLEQLDDVEDADDPFDIVSIPIFLVLSLVSSFCIDDFETKF